MKWHKTIPCPLCETRWTVRLGGVRWTRGHKVQVFYCVHCGHKFSESRLITLENWEEVLEARSWGNKRTADQAHDWLVKTGRVVPAVQVQNLARAPAAGEVA